MANWCSSVVWFEGNVPAIQKLKKLFEEMAKKEKSQSEGQLPACVKGDKGWFHNIRWEDNVLYYETKWAPNTPVLQSIADNYKVGFTHDYEEMGCLIYGKAVYSNGILSDTFLESEDFDKYEIQEDKDTWLFEGMEYESDFEILEILLERKLQSAKIE